MMVSSPAGSGSLVPPGSRSRGHGHRQWGFGFLVPRGHDPGGFFFLGGNVNAGCETQRRTGADRAPEKQKPPEGGFAPRVMRGVSESIMRADLFRRQFGCTYNG